MKKRLISILVLCCMILLCSCNKEEPKTKTIWLLQEERQVVTTTDRVDGKLVTSEGETLYTYTYTYDEKGNVTAETKAEAGKDPVHLTYTYEYDSKGQISRTTVRNGDRIKSDIRYTYDDRGNLLSENSATLGGTIRENRYTYDAQNRLLTETDMNDPKLSGSVHTYDDEKHTHTIEKYSNYQVTSTQVITYDDTGRILSDDAGGKRYFYTYEYQDGLSVKYTWNQISGQIREDNYDKQISYYDDKGLLTREEIFSVMEHKEKDLEMIDSRIQYSYDENGNLIIKIEEGQFQQIWDMDSKQWVPDYAKETVKTLYTYVSIQVPA